MGSVSQAALKSGAPVTGIMPHLLVNREAPEHNLTELILTDSMSERKLLMFEKSDFFIVLPGGVGTLDESFEVVTDNWLKLFRKPLGFLNVNGFYEPLKQFTDLAVKEGFIDPKCMELCLFEEEAERLIKKLLEKV